MNPNDYITQQTGEVPHSLSEGGFSETTIEVKDSMLTVTTTAKMPVGLDQAGNVIYMDIPTQMNFTK